ncbi:membrane hypothetical protein [Syntrophobacter sp. SbD1]|nr:membrane hypothetical protein [Syntrophobacter sp. SbD1]
MTDTIPTGNFKLAPEVRLIDDEEGGVILQLSPLRAMRVNQTAFEILNRCRTGYSYEDFKTCGFDNRTKPTLSFLDSMCAAHILQWAPDPAIAPPFVSIIVPVYNRADEVAQCLESLLRLNYPVSLREIIVVDDASDDSTADVVRAYGNRIKFVANRRNLGQSAARNVGVSIAAGEVLAFIDSDCTADVKWLEQLTPYFQDPRIALVGGYVASHFRKTWLDRYEDAKSPLSMGKHTIICNDSNSDFYVPTCNMLVRKKAYLEAGGLDESLRVGEDVDLCWKLKKQNHRLIYVPEGRVDHKHRNRFPSAFKRRFDYGTSEPVLYAGHREVSKRFPSHPAALLFCLSCCLGLITRPFLFSFFSCLIVIGWAFENRAAIRKKTNVSLAFGDVVRATFKNCYAMAYHLSLHFVRYYFLLVLPLMLIFPPACRLLVAVVLFPLTVEFFSTRPRLPFPVFMFFFLMEQSFYQAGVFSGCLKVRSFRCYHLRFGARRTKKERVSTLGAQSSILRHFSSVFSVWRQHP